jgi:peptidoglycan-associated lipoprotein
MPRLSRVAVLLVAVPLALSACKKKPAAVEPEPQIPTSTATPPSTNNTADEDAAPRAAAEAVRKAIEAARSALLETIFYDYDSDDLRSDARATLDAKLRVLNANPSLRIRIEGHCDERGTDQYNLALGRRRAAQAKQYLLDRGIDASRIETVSYGRERPVVQGGTEEAFAQNRRGEFQIIAGGEELKAP